MESPVAMPWAYAANGGNIVGGKRLAIFDAMSGVSLTAAAGNTIYGRRTYAYRARLHRMPL